MADTTILMTRGDSHAFTVTVRDGANQLVNLTGRTLWFTAKRQLADTDGAGTTIQKSSGAGITHLDQTTLTGQATVTIGPADTSGLPASVTIYECDVQLVDGGTPYTVLPAPGERFRLEVWPDATQRTS